MELAVLLPIAAFIALAAGLAVVLRGTGRIVKRTRELEHFRGSVRDLAVRVDASLGAAAGQIDAVRRRQIGPDTIVDTIAAATDAVDRYADEAKALHGPRKAQTIRQDLVGELERARRALEMVEHGASMMLMAGQGTARARGADLDQAWLSQPDPRPGGIRAPCPRGAGPRDRRDGGQGRSLERLRPSPEADDRRRDHTI